RRHTRLQGDWSSDVCSSDLDLHNDLPRLLWLYQMALILFWLFDDSSGQRRTKKLTDGSLDLVVRLIQLSSLPFMAPLRKRVIARSEERRVGKECRSRRSRES